MIFAKLLLSSERFAACESSCVVRVSRELSENSDLEAFYARKKKFA